MRSVDRLALDAMPAKQRRVAESRLEILFRLIERRRAGEALTAATEQLARQLTREHPRQPISLRTLYRWWRDYEQRGVSGLVDRRVGAVRTPGRQRTTNCHRETQFSEILDHAAALVNAIGERWGLQVTRRS